ncbi:MAG: DUF2029 domain-containing protein [Planctomycetia bacterium]|nr:DUF2029 domain-containing protein [Planctomycetia bacterium]
MQATMTTRPHVARRLVYVLVAVAVQSLLAGLTNLGKFQPARPGSPTRVDDTDLYFRYATLVLDGKTPYRDFLVEYPPLALPVFLAPGAVSRGLHGYKMAFAVEMLAFNALTVWVVAGRVEERDGPDRVPLRLAWYTVFVLLLSRFLVSRYDAAPMLLGFASAVWWATGRNRLGGLSAALGTCMKFYPALVAVFAGSRELLGVRKSRGRGTIVFTSTLFLGLGAWLAFDGPGGVSRSLGYHVGRGFEYGSLYSGLQLLAAKAVGGDILIARDHASYSSFTRWSPRLIPLVFPLQGFTVLLVWVIFNRRGGREVVRYSGAAILAFIVTGKVFSPQFLIWLIPFISVLEGSIAKRGRRVFAAGCLATLLAPSGTPYFPRTSYWIIVPYNVKNALFLWLLYVLVCGPAADRADDELPGVGDAPVNPRQGVRARG